MVAGMREKPGDRGRWPVRELRGADRKREGKRQKG